MSARSMYQPPNPEDMRRLPPASPSCARVRAKLRDYADGDLAIVDVASVDEHMQGCRLCAVELARAEHEVLRLRLAFEDVRVEQETDPKYALRSDFAARVVEQLVLTDADAVDVSSGDASSVDNSSGVSHSRNASAAVAVTREEAGAKSRKSTRREREYSFTSPAGMLVAGLFALVALVIGARVMDLTVGQPEPVHRLVILSAEDCLDANRQVLDGGDIVGNDDGLWARSGTAKVEWSDDSERAQPAATIEVMQGGELKFSRSGPMLVDGQVRVETNRRVMIPMSDGSHLALGKGEYLITAIPADMVDRDFGPDGDDPWGTASRHVRIEIEVISGDDARILRSGVSTGIVAVGDSANYQGGGRTYIYPSHTPGGIYVGGDRKPAPAPPAGANWHLDGHVMGPSGQPSVGATVGITYVAGEGKYSDVQSTGANGGFSSSTHKPVDTKFGVAFSVPNGQRSDLGLVAPDAVPLLINGAVAQLERPLSIGYSTSVSAMVTDDLGVPRFGVQVVPLIIDELFGSVYAIELKKVVSAQNGRFIISQLPAYLPRHQRLALLLSHELLETVVVPVPVRGSVLASLENQTHVMPRLRFVGLVSLPLSSAVTILEEIPGLPVGSAVVRRVVQANNIGFVPQVRVGSGRIWMHSNSVGSRLYEMLEQSTGQNFTLLIPAANWVNYKERLRPFENLAGTQVSLESSIRHEVIQVDEIPNIVQSLALHVTDASLKDVRRAQVFAVALSPRVGDPDTRFLGFTGDTGVLSLGAVKANEDVFVIGPGGGLAWASRPTTVASIALPLGLQLEATGRVLLGESLRPAPASTDRFVKITFYRDPNEVLEGMQPVAVRFATDDHWEMSALPAGSYIAEVRGVQYPVVVPSSGFWTLEGQ
ncbi:MAG: hypothetical protein ACI89X_000948 [Planctomycetota bacterium]|jgi:hypothetical protein